MEHVKPWGSVSTALRATTDGSPLVAEVRYEQLRGNKHAHFSITGTGYRSSRVPGESTVHFRKRTWWVDRCGCLHDEIAEVFPELAPFIRWHLADPSGPMHYVANAVYWAEKVYGCSRWPASPYGEPDPRKAFESTVVLGAVDGDAFPEIVTENDDGAPLDAVAMRALVRARVTDWCAARQPALIAAFERDMAQVHALLQSGALTQ